MEGLGACRRLGAQPWALWLRTCGRGWYQPHVISHMSQLCQVIGHSLSLADPTKEYVSFQECDDRVLCIAWLCLYHFAKLLG